jgi:DNA-directed RNA polymerase specialized sigma24 family protein
MTEELRSRFGDLVRRGVFNPVARHIVGNDQDDRLQDAVAQTWEAYCRYAERGVHLDTALLVRMTRLRAVDLGRRLVRGGQPRRDAMDIRNYLSGRTQVFHLDGLVGEDDDWQGDGDVGLQAAWFAATSADPAEQLAAAVDLDGWLMGLAPADRELLSGRLAGYSLQELAVCTDRSVTAVFQRLRELGVDLASHAGVIVKRKKRKPRSRTVAASC